MARLQFQQLPAQQQDPMKTLQGQHDQKFRYLKSQYENEARALEGVQMDEAEFGRRASALNAKHTSLFNKFKFDAQQQAQQLQQIDALVQQGSINPEAAKEALWRIVLPQETERAMFPGQGAQQTPYSMSQMRGAISVSIDEFAQGATDTPGLEWGDPKKETDSLINQYMKWRSLIGYDNLNPVRQNQLDMQWDAKMHDEDKFGNWFSDDGKRKPMAQISALRPTGRIGDAMKKRVLGSISVTGSPLGASVKKQKEKMDFRFSKPGVYDVPKQETREQPSADQLKRAGTEEAYNAGVKLGYWN